MKKGLFKINESNYSSKGLVKATNNYHDAQLILQQLQKKFISINPKDTVERENLKKQIIDATKKVKETEKIFQQVLGSEDIDDFEI